MLFYFPKPQLQFISISLKRLFISSTRSALCLIDLVWNHKDSCWYSILRNRRHLTSEPHSLQGNNLWADYQKHNNGVKVQPQGMNSREMSPPTLKFQSS